MKRKKVVRKMGKKMKGNLEMELTEQVELEVYGLVVGPEQARPLLLMKDKKGGNILPVALSTLEAQIMAFGSDRQDGPHGTTLVLMKELGYKLEKAVFSEVRGARQVLEYYFSSANITQAKKIEVFAESSISFALANKAPIFASIGFIEQCRRTPLDFVIGDQVLRDRVPPGLLQ